MRKLHRSSFIIHYSLLIMMLFIIASCTPSTSPKTGSLSGRVILVNDTGDTSFDPVDFSGVTVGLYELAVLDTTIVRINQEYPQIGVQISQETEFDHRLQKPIKTVQSSGDGTFSINGITVGKYNLVIFKNGWSIKYWHQIEISVGDNVIDPGKVPIELFPLRIIPTVIHDNYVFRTNRTYFFDEDANVFGDVQIEESTLILIESGKRVDFHGQVQTQQNATFSRMTSASSIYSTNIQSSPDRFLVIRFSPTTEVNIHSLILSHSHEGLVVASSGASISNVIISNVTNSLNIQAGPTTIESTLVQHSVNKGIVTQGQLTLSKCILYDARDACFIVEAESNIQDNYFVRNYIGLRPFYGVHDIKNNVFERNDYAIAPCASNPIIEYNSFIENATDIEMNQYRTHTNAYDYCNPTIRNNNFHGDKFYYHLLGKNSVYTYTDGNPRIGVTVNQSYPSNYYKQTILTSHIYDANYPGSSVPFIVNYMPRANLPLASAGIRH